MISTALERELHGSAESVNATASEKRLLDRAQYLASALAVKGLSTELITVRAIYR
jgi:hypothetical protein